MNSRKSISYVPDIYKGFEEFGTLVNLQDALIDISETELDKLAENQFVATAHEDGIRHYETMLKIVPDPVTEDLDFRRSRIINRLSSRPPFTLLFLKKRLDEIIGEGKYDAYVDYDNYTIYVESSATDQLWFNEILITMNRVKPANMIFINKPLVSVALKMSEEVSYKAMKWNYVLGISFVLGSLPFVSYSDKGVIKMSSIPSATPLLLQSVADFTVTDIDSVLLNDTYPINTFITKAAVSGVCTLEYEVPFGAVAAVTSIKLLNASSGVLLQSSVYAPVLEDIVIKHTIMVKEG